MRQAGVHDEHLFIEIYFNYFVGKKIGAEFAIGVLSGVFIFPDIHIIPLQRTYLQEIVLTKISV